MSPTQQAPSRWQRWFNPYGEFLNPASLTPDELRRREDLAITGSLLCLALFAGLAAVILRFLIPFFILGFTGQGWRLTGQTLTSFIWALAWFISSFVLGFLFGIPKTQNRQTQAKPGSQSIASTQPLGADASGTTTPYQLKVNTNLEEVSDWLTKILLGAGLTQLTKMPALFAKAADYMSQGCSAACSDTERVFAGGVILFFSGLGFFAGYVVTRMYFASAFARVDPDGDNRVAVASLAKSPTPTGEHPEAEKYLQESAERSLSIPLSGDISATTASALAKGALLTGHTNRALQAASIAVSKTPNDPRVALDYAVALNSADASSTIVLGQIDKVHAEIPAGLDPRTKEELYNSMVYLCLYQDPPDGFQKAIRLGEEFLLARNPVRSASIYINLACAYGQLYAHLKAGGKLSDASVPGTLEAATEKAIKMIEQALTLEPATKQRFIELATAGANIDDDLAVMAEHEPRVRNLLGL